MKTLAIVLLLAAPAFAADPELLKLAMPEARLVAGIDVAAVKSTPFGRFALAQLTAAQDPQYDAFVKASGFDPAVSLDEIVTALGECRLVLARGRFDTARILDAARAAGAGVSAYQGVDMLISPDIWLAFVNGSIVALGDPACVRALVERRQKGGGLPAAAAARIDVLSKAYPLWFLSTMPVAELISALPIEGGGDALKNGALESVRAASGGVSFSDPVRLSAELTAASPEDASKLAALLKFVGGATAQGPVDVSAEGSVVRLGLAFSETQLEALVKQAQ